MQVRYLTVFTLRLAELNLQACPLSEALSVNPISCQKAVPLPPLGSTQKVSLLLTGACYLVSKKCHTEKSIALYKWNRELIFSCLYYYSDS